MAVAISRQRAPRSLASSLGLAHAAQRHARNRNFYNTTQPYDDLLPGAHAVVNAYFTHHWHPTVQCKRMARYPGTARMDGKRLCDLPACLRQSSNPLVISVGSNGIFTFEDSIKAVDPRVGIGVEMKVLGRLL